MIILIGLLLSAIIVAPESVSGKGGSQGPYTSCGGWGNWWCFLSQIQEEQKAAQNAEQLVRELDQERMDATAYEKVTFHNWAVVFQCFAVIR